VRSNSKTREDRATVMLAEYCAFGRERYKKYWDEQIEPLEGTFLILCVSSSFILLDDCNLSASGHSRGTVGMTSEQTRTRTTSTARRPSRSAPPPASTPSSAAATPSNARSRRSPAPPSGCP
jgi:hypothetical protein